MSRVIAVLGLCGSGKSRLIRQLAAEGFLDLDEGVFPGLHNWDSFIAALQAGQDCVVVEIALYRADVRRWFASVLAGFPASTLEYRCYENDADTANENCRKDYANGKRTQAVCDENIDQNRRTLEAFSLGLYSFPEQAIFLKVERA